MISAWICELFYSFSSRFTSEERQDFRCLVLALCPYTMFSLRSLGPAGFIIRARIQAAPSALAKIFLQNQKRKLPRLLPSAGPSLLPQLCRRKEKSHRLPPLRGQRPASLGCGFGLHSSPSRRCINQSLCRPPGTAAARPPAQRSAPVPPARPLGTRRLDPAPPKARAPPAFPPAPSAAPAVGRGDLLISAVSCKCELMSYFRKLILIPGIRRQGCLADYPSFLSAYKQ